jgi:uncharacterized cupin superfamily protein
MSYERMNADFPGSTLSAFIITLPPGYQSEVTSHDGEEFVYQLEGTSQFEIDDEHYTLNVGDSLHFRSSRRHSWSNRSDKVAKISWIGTSHHLRREFNSSTARNK